MGILADILKSLAFPPLQGPIAQKLLGALGVSLDVQEDPTAAPATPSKIRQAMLAHIPTYQLDPSALAPMGDDRLIDRGFQETNANYALRLKQAYDAWAHAGSAIAELQQLLGYVFPAAPTVKLIHQTSEGANTYTTWYTAPAGAAEGAPPIIQRVSPTHWNWDNVFHNELWWRTWIVIYPPNTLWTQGAKWGDGHLWGDGTCWGYSGTANQSAAMRALIRKWKAKHTWVQWVILSFDATLFDPSQASGGGINPDGTWANWSVYTAGLQQRARFAAASYMIGTPYKSVHGGAGSTIDIIGA